jgi:hypothetical protein
VYFYRKRNECIEQKARFLQFDQVVLDIIASIESGIQYLPGHINLDVGVKNIVEHGTFHNNRVTKNIFAYDLHGK